MLAAEQAATESAAEAAPAEENPAPETADIDPVMAAMMADAAATEAPAPAIDIDTEEIPQTPVPMDMDAASDAMEGAVEDIESFLDSEDYEYLTVKSDGNTLFLMKTADNNAMAIAYEGNDFDSLETAYNKDGKTAYKDIMNTFVKETIKNGGNSAIVRHKGTKVVAR